MPHNLEAEQSVLACIMLDNDATMDAFSRLGENDFYSPTHKIIFDAMKDIFRKGTPIDFVTLVDYLGQHGTLEKVGGVGFITALNDTLPSSANFSHYVGILKKNRVLRKLIVAGNTIIDGSYTSEDEQNALQLAERAVFDIAREDERRELTAISQDMPGVMETLDLIHRDPTALRGLQTGFYGLDKATNGLQKSDLIIIAARPSVGKTALALNIVTNAALQRKAKCAVFSLEMGKQQLATRALCSVGHVSLTRALKGDLDSDEWNRLWAANRRLAGSNIYVDDNSVITPAEIMRKCMRLKREQGLDLVLIDYLGLMTSGTGKRESRQVEVSDNCRMIKIMAKELDVPVLLLSQLNRGVESRKGDDAKPVLSDLRESGAIEQDADIVMFIHRPTGPEVDRDNCEMDLLIAKHRNGPCVDLKLQWRGEFTSFTNKQSDQSAQTARDAVAPAPVAEKPAEKPKPKATPVQADVTDVF